MLADQLPTSGIPPVKNSIPRELAVDGSVVLLSKLLYWKQTCNVCPTEDELFGAYNPKPKRRIGFRYSLGYSILFIGVGLSVTLLDVLLKG